MISTPDQIIETLEVLKRGSKAIEEQIFDLAIYMPNGPISLNELYGMSPKQRNMLAGKLNTHYEAQSKDTYIVNEG